MAGSIPLEVSTPGGTLRGERWPGSGPVAVFLHAGVTDRRSWYGVIDQLTESITPVTYDRRGFGETPVSEEAFSHVDDLLALLDVVADGPAWLIGSSMGGALALDTALVAPHRVAGLILIAPGVSGGPEFDLDPDTSRFERLLDDAIDKQDLKEINRLETWLWLDGPGQPEGRVPEPIRAQAREMNEIILRNKVPEEAGASGQNAWDRVSDVRAPTTIACGDLDVPSLVERSRELADRLPSGRFVELKGVAHLPQMENPAMVAHLVREATFQRDRPPLSPIPPRPPP